ncbi:MAG: hypothetical protein EZS28_032628 [Streblomastix strix]|uniref:FAD/NAD(P)-binding domain-containing protein n=1 Tax=Streblomastix strix TaxID=222440 RepID=A0A5J4UMF1_9EUKA|nr:MAG: hypothetical protein EZS28_032628 [Streblomastix strix]
MKCHFNYEHNFYTNQDHQQQINLVSSQKFLNTSNNLIHHFFQLKQKKGSIIPSVPGNIPATEYPAQFISVTPSTHHSLFVIPTPFRPPAPALFVVNSCNYTAATLSDLGLQRYIEEIPGVVLNIDREKREIILEDGSLVPYDMLIIAAGLQDQTLKRLSQPIAENDFHVDVADGAITMNDEADATRLQRFIYKPTHTGGKKLLEDEDEIGVKYGATLRAYSVLLGLLQAGVPSKRLLSIRPTVDTDANSMNHERRIDAFEGVFKRKFKDGYYKIHIDKFQKGDLASFVLFDDPDSKINQRREISIQSWNKDC